MLMSASAPARIWSIWSRPPTRRNCASSLDIIFHHSGHNWDYANGQTDPSYKPWPDHYEKGPWIASDGSRQSVIAGNDDGVWPAELQVDNAYTRAGKGDRYLRETMFGAAHPRLAGRAGIPAGAVDVGLPGFGAFGSVGAHFFDPSFHVYRRIKELARIRALYPVLRYGRQYLREISNFDGPFAVPGAGELIPWSRILDDEEALCIANGHGTQARGGDVLVSIELNWGAGAAFQVIANTAQTIAGAAYVGTHPVGERVAVRVRNGTAYVAIRDVAPSEIVVLSNRP